METTQKINETYQDKEYKDVFSMRLGYENFIEYMGGEFTLWDMERGELKNPQKMTSERIEQIKRFIAEMEAKK
tara:strand:- start:256 stop:474 length:219 start_codon:yes stop_codon:yes gene_type:complete